MAKRVLLVTGSLNIGGLETVAMDFVRFSDKTKYQFDILIYSDSVQDYQEEAEQLGCKIIRIHGIKKGYISFINSLKKIFLEKGPYDIVHAHTFFNSAIVMMVAKRCGVPCCISHSHSIARIEDDKLKKKCAYIFLRLMLNHYSDKFCACSKAAGEYVFGRKGFARCGTVICNPVDIERFAYNQGSRKKIREELGIALEQYIVGNVGRVVSGKNISFLIDIIAQYKRDNNIFLLIVGDGNKRAEVENYARQCGVYDKVRFVGIQTNVQDYLSAMDVFVMPSRHEGLGIVLIEAMANGLPCVYEKHAIVAEISNIRLGFPVDDFEPLQWKGEIDKLVQYERHDLDVIKKELSVFDISGLCKQIDELYK